MIKILFVIHDLGGGGAEKVLVNLVNSLDRNLFDITVLSMFGGGVNEQFLNQDVRLIHFFPRAVRGNRFVLRMFPPEVLHRWMIKEKYDIEVSFLEGVAARVVSGCPNEDTKKISWIHVEQKTPETASLSFRNIEEAAECYSRFDRTAAVSGSVADDFHALFPMIEKADVLYNPQNPQRILQLAKEPSKGLPKKDSAGFKLIGIGKLMPNKGFDKLISITERLINEGMDVTAYILGCGKEQEHLEELIREKHLEDHVFLMGYQVNPYPLIREADLFVCTSQNEGFSTAAAESLILGVPAASTPAAGMHEMLQDWADTAVSQDYSAESMYPLIRNLIQDKELYQAYRRDTARLSEQFSQENTLGKIQSYLLDTMAE